MSADRKPDRPEDVRIGRPAERKISHVLNALRLLAILLVFNSHCDELYPIKALATGGAMGNALFFIISGYLLKTEGTFWPWIRDKFVRLYPPTLLVTVVYALLFRSWPGSVLSLLRSYVWPTGYWFVGAFLLFNVIIYWLDRYHAFDRFLRYSVVVWAVYLLYYVLFIDKTVWSVEEHGPFRLIYYFFIYSLGYCIRTRRVTLPKRGTANCAVLAATCFAGSIVLKFGMVKVPVLMNLQFLCQILGVFFALWALQAALQGETGYRKLPEKLMTAVDFLSRHSLEIYLTQRTCQRLARGIPFPLNLLAALALTVVYSVLLQAAFRRLRTAGRKTGAAG